MTATSSDSTQVAANAAPPDTSKGKVEGGPIANIDFAHVVDRYLIVYGWILGFGTSVDRASIEVGGIVVELAKKAITVRRPDVAQHFSLKPGNEEHGFYALIDLPTKMAAVETLKLSVSLSSGASGDSRWPVSCCEALPDLKLSSYASSALLAILPRLPRKEARHLIEVAGPALGLPKEQDYLVVLPPPVRFGVDLCCILDKRFLLVIGWFLDPTQEVSATEISVGRSLLPFLKNSVVFARSDIAFDTSFDIKSGGTQTRGFGFIAPMPSEDGEQAEASFLFSIGSEPVRMTQAVTNISQDARRDLLALLSKLEAEPALEVIEYLAEFLRGFPEDRPLAALLELTRRTTIKRLPSSVEHSDPRYFLHVDRVIPIDDEGLFLTGWFYVEPEVSVRVSCHRRSSSFEVSESWHRYARQDVKSHLDSIGIRFSTDEGFSCWIPLKGHDEPAYLSAALESGDARRMRLPIDIKPEPALQTVRDLLSTFSASDPNLGFVLDHHIGPAVSTAWAARSKSRREHIVRNYGARPNSPALSIIVPLYGRFDFAEYQIALFADDREFQHLELIYVVDDPSIWAEFATLCPDLYAMYQVPFVLASSGMNLGFAGANNLGADVARGEHLLLMNSDVMPTRPGWTSDLLRIYKSLPSPGLLGTKLLYEDGSIQHAGIAFRRCPAWNNLWINDHPLKGQTPLALTGVHEADAVTAACTLSESSLYKKLGGLCEDYIVGDFEDSDLCLRALAAGRRNYVTLDVELYHLERQSQNRVGDNNLRANYTLYNCWLHNQRWARVIEERKNQQSSVQR